MMAKGSQPRVRMRDTEMKPEPDALSAWRRGGTLFVGILNPLIAITGAVALLTVPRIKKPKPVWVLLGSVIVFVASLLLGALKFYIVPYRELLSPVLSLATLDDVRALVGNMVAILADNWWRFVAHQLWFASVAGLLYGAIVSKLRSRYAADWREEALDPEVDAKKVDKAVKHLGRWPQKKAATLDELLIRFGVDEATLSPFDVAMRALRLHLYISGPSGFGKTTTLIELLRGLVEAPAAQPYRIGVVFITMKPDPDITDEMIAMAARHGRRVHIVTHDGQGATTTYNPLKYGNSSSRRDLLINAEENAKSGGFSEPHYQRTGTRFTQLALRALEARVSANQTYTVSGSKRAWKMDLHHLVKSMSLSSLQDVQATGGDERLSADIASYMAEIEEDKDTADGVGGMRSRFAVIDEGAAGEVLEEHGTGLDLREAIRAGDLVIFNLDAGKDEAAAQYVANLALSDYRAAMADLAAVNWHGGSSTPNRMNMCIVDEFSALGGTGLKHFLERARSQGAAIALTNQSYGALVDDTSEGFRASLMTNTYVKMLHQEDYSADDYASFIGTRTVMKETVQTFEDKDLIGSQARASGQGSLREADQFTIHPNVLRGLGPGEVIALVKHPWVATRVKIRRSKAGEPVQPKKELTTGTHESESPREESPRRPVKRAQKESAAPSTQIEDKGRQVTTPVPVNEEAQEATPSPWQKAAQQAQPAIAEPRESEVPRWEDEEEEDEAPPIIAEETK